MTPTEERSLWVTIGGVLLVLAALVVSGDLDPAITVLVTG